MTPLGYRLDSGEFTPYPGRTVHWALSLNGKQDPPVILSLATGKNKLPTDGLIRHELSYPWRTLTVFTRVASTSTTYIFRIVITIDYRQSPPNPTWESMQYDARTH